MKSLQNNFTTQEQSKRLLELGVPEWTADCLIKNNAEKDEPTIRVKEPCTGYYFANDEYIPCWSVGRLIEICKICSNVPIDWTGGLNEERENLEVVYSTLYALYLGNHMDFSKLEE